MILQIENLDLYYGDAQALDRVSLEVGKGELVAIVGANGAGKSSLIRTIAGIERPRGGKIRFKGEDITGRPSYVVCNLGIGQVAEGRQIFPSLSVQENLEMGALLPRARAKLSSEIERVYSLFPRLAERREQFAGTMSGGEQQMLAIGRALMINPRLLLLDEPMEGLAPLIVQDLLRVMGALVKDGTIAIIIVEQHARLALSLARQALVLDRGRVVHRSDSASLLADPATLHRLVTLS